MTMHQWVNAKSDAVFDDFGGFGDSVASGNWIHAGAEFAVSFILEEIPVGTEKQSRPRAVLHSRGEQNSLGALFFTQVPANSDAVLPSCLLQAAQLEAKYHRNVDFLRISPTCTHFMTNTFIEEILLLAKVFCTPGIDDRKDTTIGRRSGVFNSEGHL